MSRNEPLPPQCNDSEMSVLGAVFLDNSCMDTVQSILKADDFYRIQNRLIFEAMSVLSNKSEPVDPVTLANVLRPEGKLEEVGGVAYLYTLEEYTPIAANVGHYCKIVAEKSAERKLILNAREAIGLAYQGGRLDEAVAKLEGAIQPALAKNDGPAHVQLVARDAAKRIEFRYENKGQITGIPYGIDDLDRATLGAQGGELIILAGRPSMGKSALAGNFIKSFSEEGKAGVLFTLEMGKLDIVDRLTASYRVKYQNIRSGRMQENDWPKLTKAMGAIHEWKLHIDDTPAISLQEVRNKARQLRMKGELHYLVIDYLQLMSLSDPRMSRVQGIGEISRGLKQLARELGIPVIALSQLSRSVDSRNDKRPMMSDLRDSGEIEQDADVIMFPYRPAAYCEKCRDKIDDAEHNYADHQGKAEIIIEKQRAGERNISIPAVWMGEYQVFGNINRYDYDAPCPY